MLGPSPTFYRFFSVLMWLMISDIIWLPPFFFIILFRIITRSMFSDIFWPSPLFFYFLSGIQNWIFSDIFWRLLLLFTFDDLKFFFFLIIFYPIITRSIFCDIFWFFRFFFNFSRPVTKLVFNHFCQNIEHEFETWYQQQWLKWLGRHCFNAMIEWIVESLPRKWILLEYKLIWFMFH